MNWRIANRLTRIHRYFDRVRSGIKEQDAVQAMADCAELDFQVQALYKELKEFAAKAHPNSVS